MSLIRFSLLIFLIPRWLYSYQQSSKTVVANCDAAILYQTFGGKSEPLQTHLSNWFAVTQKQSAHLGFLLPLWYILKELFLFCRPEEEAGSAGEQPASNKVETMIIEAA